MDIKKQIADNPFRKIFSKEIWGGMEMASIAIHKDDLESVATYDPDDKLKPVYKDIRIEIKVAGHGLTTTLDKILENNEKAWRYDQLNK